MRLVAGLNVLRTPAGIGDFHYVEIIDAGTQALALGSR